MIYDDPEQAQLEADLMMRKNPDENWVLKEEPHVFWRESVARMGWRPVLDTTKVEIDDNLIRRTMFINT